MNDCYRIKGDVIHVALKALPGASKTEFAGIKDERLRVKIAAAPEGGRANAELVSFIAKTLGCPARDVVLLQGEKSRLKTIALPVACRAQLNKILQGVLK